MRRLARITLLAVCALAALVAAGCNKEEQVHLAATEGIYVTVDDLKYQIQISRYLNQHDVEDETYLTGLPTGTEQPTGDETWFGVTFASPTKAFGFPNKRPPKEPETAWPQWIVNAPTQCRKKFSTWSFVAMITTSGSASRSAVPTRSIATRIRSTWS